MKNAPINLPPLPDAVRFLKPSERLVRQQVVPILEAYARAAVIADRAGWEEPTRSQRMREAGFTARDKRLECDECGAKFTAQFAPLHECAAPSPAEPPKYQMCTACSADSAGNYWHAPGCPNAPAEPHVAIEVKLNEKIESLKAENERLQKELRQTQEYGHEQWGRALAAQSQAAAMAGLLEEARFSVDSQALGYSVAAWVTERAQELLPRIDAGLAAWKGKQ